MKTTNPFVSVLMCVYNGQAYVDEAIDSILKQTYTDFELIVVNDGSTDGTRGILEKYEKQDARVRLIHQENTGLTKALNVGLAHCCGAWVARQDADDVSEVFRLERQIDYVRKHSEVGLLGAGCSFIHEQGCHTLEKDIPLYADHEALQRALYLRNPFVHSSIFVKRELVDKGRGYDESYRVAQDYELWLRLSFQTRMAQIPEKLVKRRITGQMISSKYTAEQRRNVLRAKWKYGVFRSLNVEVWSFIMRDMCRALKIK